MTERTEFKGWNGVIVVNSTDLLIERRGPLSGRASEWRYPLAAVSGVSKAEPGTMKNGWLTILIGGQPDPRLTLTTATNHKNTVLFSKQQSATLDSVSEYLTSVVEHHKSHAIDAAAYVAGGTGGDTAGLSLAVFSPEHANPEAQATRQGLRPDIEQASNAMALKFGSKREIKRLESHLHHGEEVSHMARGQYGREVGLVVLTNLRLIFFSEGFVGHSLEDFPIEKVSSVQNKSGLMGGSLTIYASGNTAEISSIQAADAKRIADAIRAAINLRSQAAQAPVGSPIPAQPQIDVADQIAKLAALRDQGILTEDEFSSQKSKLLEL